MLSLFYLKTFSRIPSSCISTSLYHSSVYGNEGKPIGKYNLAVSSANYGNTRLGLFFILPVKVGMLTSCCGSSRSSFPPLEKIRKFHFKA